MAPGRGSSTHKQAAGYTSYACEQKQKEMREAGIHSHRAFDGSGCWNSQNGFCINMFLSHNLHAGLAGWGEQVGWSPGLHWLGWTTSNCSHTLGSHGGFLLGMH